MYNQNLYERYNNIGGFIMESEQLVKKLATTLLWEVIYLNVEKKIKYLLC